MRGQILTDRPSHEDVTLGSYNCMKLFLRKDYGWLGLFIAGQRFAVLSNANGEEMQITIDYYSSRLHFHDKSFPYPLLFNFNYENKTLEEAFKSASVNQICIKGKNDRATIAIFNHFISEARNIFKIWTIDCQNHKKEKDIAKEQSQKLLDSLFEEVKQYNIRK